MDFSAAQKRLNELLNKEYAHYEALGNFPVEVCVHVVRVGDTWGYEMGGAVSEHDAMRVAVVLLAERGYVLGMGIILERNDDDSARRVRLLK